MSYLRPMPVFLNINDPAKANKPRDKNKGHKAVTTAPTKVITVEPMSSIKVSTPANMIINDWIN